jgi:hypothetical protein
MEQYQSRGSGYLQPPAQNQQASQQHQHPQTQAYQLQQGLSQAPPPSPQHHFVVPQHQQQPQQLRDPRSSNGGLGSANVVGGYGSQQQVSQQQQQHSAYERQSAIPLKSEVHREPIQRDMAYRGSANGDAFIRPAMNQPVCLCLTPCHSNVCFMLQQQD